MKESGVLEKTALVFGQMNEPPGARSLALSRSIVHEGKFFIMDEPTSALDPRSEQEIFEKRKVKNVSSLFTSLFTQDFKFKR